MDRNLLLAVALSVAVYAAWCGFLETRFNPQPVKPAVAATAGGRAGFAPEADGEGLDPHPEPARHQEMPELVHEGDDGHHRQENGHRQKKLREVAQLEPPPSN